MISRLGAQKESVLGLAEKSMMAETSKIQANFEN